MTNDYDAILVVSFGGPEKREDVMPFLRHVVRGKPVPEERLRQVAEHYYHFDGKSPINDQVRALVRALEDELAANGPGLPVYWGNRHWHPFLKETLARMRDDGVRRALAFFTSAYSSYSGCRQYREDLERAREEVGPGAPEVDKLRAFFNHPGFIEPMVENVEAALDRFPAIFRDTVKLVFTAHSIPVEMAATSRYVEQVTEASRLVAERIGLSWTLVYQSRSGPPSQPWLEPDICDYFHEVARERTAQNLVVVPIGFLSDHMEVIYDLDIQAQETAQELGLKMVRAPTVGVHPRFIRMIRELILERLDQDAPRHVLGDLPIGHDACPPDCCPCPVPAPGSDSAARPGS